MTIVCLLLCNLLIPTNGRVKELGKRIRHVNFVDEFAKSAGEEINDVVNDVSIEQSASEAATSANTKYLINPPAMD